MSLTVIPIKIRSNNAELCLFDKFNDYKGPVCLTGLFSQIMERGVLGPSETYSDMFCKSLGGGTCFFSDITD